MKNINRANWNNVESKTFGNFHGLEPGWYPCVILDAKEGESSWGTPTVTFSFDIIDGEYVRYFEKDYKASTLPDKKWRGTLEQAIDERGLPYFKGMITAIENSNPGFAWDFDETKLKGKKVGIGFRKEWYERNGEDKYVVKAFSFADIAKVLTGELETPKDKQKRNATAASAPVPPVVAAFNSVPAPGTAAPKYEPLTDSDELPF